MKVGSVDFIAEDHGMERPASVDEYYIGKEGGEPRRSRTSPPNNGTEGIAVGDIILYRAMKIMYTTMAVFGLYYMPAEHQQSRQKRWIWKLINGRNFCFLVTLMSWFGVLRFIHVPFVHQKPGNPNFVIKLVCLLWFIQCACNTTVCFVACSRSLGLHTFFRNWQEFCQSEQSISLGLTFPEQKVKKKVIAGVVICLCIVIGCALYVIVLLFGELGSSESDIAFSLEPFGSNLPNYALFVVPNNILSQAAFLFPALHFILICKFLSSQFDAITSSLSKQIGRDGSFTGDLEAIRQEHQRLCNITADADRIFSPFIMVTMTTGLVVGMFTLYQLFKMYDELNIVTMIFFGYWFVCMAVYLAFISCSAGTLHDKIQAPLFYLHDVSLRDVNSSDLSTQLTTFLLKLHDNYAGFTFWGLFYISKEFMITVAGAFITYFVLLTQTF
ncbi:uncharacterized protein [Ptychodera flava]|uniref:uncharacterized protein n=1 Tax=Ptychodera flava TaxID=63121 RepID=UPI00396A18A1